MGKEKTPAMNRSHLYYLGIALSAVFLIVGILYPCMTINPPKDNKLLDLAGAFDPKMKAVKQELSVLGGIKKLYQSGEWFIATLIGLFSIIFPVGKLVLLLWLIYEKDHAKKPRVMALIDKVSKYSMLDVMIMALLLLCIKALPGNFTVTLNYGLYCFAISLLISFAISYLLHRDIHKQAVTLPPPPPAAAAA